MTTPNRPEAGNMQMTSEQVSTTALREHAAKGWDADNCLLPKTAVLRIANELDSLRALLSASKPATPAELWMPELALWLRGEAGRHMASIAPKGATVTSHALQLRLWAEQLEFIASHPEPASATPAAPSPAQTDESIKRIREKVIDQGFQPSVTDCRTLLAAIDARAALQAAPAEDTPEGCTVADAKMLREANHALATENELLRKRLRPFAHLVGSGELSWAMVEYCVKDDPEKQTFQAPQMQSEFNRAAEAYRNAAPQPAADAPGMAEPVAYVPVDLENGPVWRDVMTSTTQDGGRFPLRALFFHAQQPSPTAVALDDEQRKAIKAALSWVPKQGCHDVHDVLQPLTTVAQPVEQTATRQQRRDAMQLRIKVEKLAGTLTDAEKTKQDILDVDGETVTGTRLGWGAWALLRASIIDLIETKCEADERAAAQPVEQTRALTEDAGDAARYRLLRRGQHWSVINGIGDTLRGEDLDDAIDAAMIAARPAIGEKE
jgi:hypothetical protein